MELLPVEPFQETLHAKMCGPASLKMVLKYWGTEKGEKELAEIYHVNSDVGIDAKRVRAVVEPLGFTVTVKNFSTFEDVDYWLKKKIPVIVDWITRGRSDYSDSAVAGGHYSVAVGLDDDFIYILDPEIGGVRQIARNDFWKVWFDFAQTSITTWDEMIIRQIVVIQKA